MDIALYIVPLLLANLVHHGLVIPFNVFPILTKPIDGGLLVNGKRVFGSRKTLRGFLVIVVLTALFSYLLSLLAGSTTPEKWTLLGSALGFAYMFGELPNSFLKRQFEIPESATGYGPIGKFFTVFDHIDSVLFATIALYIFKRPSLLNLVALFTIGLFSHVVIDTVLHNCGYKKRLQ